MLALTVALFVLGLLIIAKGGGWFADGAIGLAARTGVPKMVIGATLMSFATTLPEFTVSFVASLSGSSATAVGNAIGSTIANVGLILALAVLIHPLKKTRIDLGPVGVALLALLLLGVFSWDLRITRIEGLVLFLLLVAFLAWQLQRLRTSKQRNSVPDEDSLDGYEGMSMKRSVLLFALGAVAVVLGSRLVVDNGIELARMFGVSELVIGLTLVSVGTSLPELVASISSARKGHTDLAAGNIVGANLFNLAFVLPGAALVSELPIEPQTLTVDLPVALALMLSVAIGLFRKSLGRTWATLALIAYIAYVAFLFIG